MSFRRMAGVAGLGFVALLVASFIFYGSPPSASSSAAEIAEYVADTGGYLLAGLLGGLGAVLMIPFSIGFAMPFFASDREHREGFGVVIVATFAAATATIGAALAALAVLGLRVDELDAAAVRTLWDLSNLAYAFSILLVIPAAGASAVAVMRHDVAPRWFGYLSGVVALLALTAIPAFLSTNDVVMLVIAGFVGMLVWVLAASVLMVREG